MAAFKLTYSKKDLFVKNLLEAECEIPASNLVTLAVEYFIFTEKYIPLGTVGMEDSHPDKTSKNLYVNNESDIEMYLQDMKSKGISNKKAIFSILNLCVEPGETTKIISRTEFLKYENELLRIKHNISQPKSRDFSNIKAGVVKEVESKKVAPSVTVEKTINKPILEEQQPRKKEKKKIGFADDFIKTF